MHGLDECHIEPPDAHHKHRHGRHQHPAPALRTIGEEEQEYRCTPSNDREAKGQEEVSPVFVDYHQARVRVWAVHALIYVKALEPRALGLVVARLYVSDPYVGAVAQVEGSGPRPRLGSEPSSAEVTPGPVELSVSRPALPRSRRPGYARP